MRRFLQFIGTVVFFCAWPAFWVYFKVGHGRTRVVLLHDGKVLVMKQWISAGKWGLPGGGLHKGEPAAEGAARELYEETHLRLDPRQLQPVGGAMYYKYGLSFEYHVFVARVGSNSVRAQRIEVSELEWVRPGELHTKNASPDTLQALQMVRDKTALLQ
ncbi:MAG TPA: NUDIX hydrolase [Candidatus Saccharimonadales bacterium]